MTVPLKTKTLSFLFFLSLSFVNVRVLYYLYKCSNVHLIKSIAECLTICLQNKIRNEIQLGIVSIFWMSFPTVGLFYWEIKGHSKLYDNPETEGGFPFAQRNVL